MGELPHFISDVPEETLKVPRTKYDFKKTFSNISETPGNAGTYSSEITFEDVKDSTIIINSVSFIGSFSEAGAPESDVFSFRLLKNDIEVSLIEVQRYIDAAGIGDRNFSMTFPFYQSLSLSRNDTLTFQVEIINAVTSFSTSTIVADCVLI